MKKHCTSNPGFKAKPTLEAISGRTKIHDMASDHYINVI